MAVDFLSDDQATGFGRFPDEVSAEDLKRFCWLDDADLSVLVAAEESAIFWDSLSN